jgi:D-aminopeptidase
LPGNEALTSINPFVAETNDQFLSDTRRRPITAAHVAAAITAASDGPVAEGCVGAGTGTAALGFKAGIGTASRRVPGRDGDRTVGVLVQANFSGTLTVLGSRLPAPARHSETAGPDQGDSARQPGNSCVIVLATDAALDARQLGRVARRCITAMALTGSDFSGHSGDYALALTTLAGGGADGGERLVPENDLNGFFAAAMEATEEAILNSLFMAESMTGFRGHYRSAVPLDQVRDLIRRSRPGSDPDTTP